MSEFIEPGDAVIICTFGITIDGQCDRIFYMIKMESIDLFLRYCDKPKLRTHWSPKPEKACLWNTAKSAKEFAEKHFKFVILDEDIEL